MFTYSVVEKDGHPVVEILDGDGYLTIFQPHHPEENTPWSSYEAADAWGAVATAEYNAEPSTEVPVPVDYIEEGKFVQPEGEINE